VKRLALPLAVALLAGCSPALPLPVPPVPPPSVAPPSPTCPAEGVRVELGPGDAAAGLRIQDFTLLNCGTADVRLSGYPAVRLLDEKQQQVTVQVLKGTDEITGPVPDWNKPPTQLTLKPGRRAAAVMAWRNTYDDITNPPVNAPLLAIAPAAGAAAQVLTPRGPIDLGSTGRIGVSAWQPAPPAGRSASS
jgi:hypothetical protein